MRLCNARLPGTMPMRRDTKARPVPKALALSRAPTVGGIRKAPVPLNAPTPLPRVAKPSILRTKCGPVDLVKVDFEWKDDKYERVTTNSRADPDQRKLSAHKCTEPRLLPFVCYSGLVQKTPGTHAVQVSKTLAPRFETPPEVGIGSTTTGQIEDVGDSSCKEFRAQERAKIHIKRNDDLVGFALTWVHDPVTKISRRLFVQRLALNADLLGN
jgi:hypothetical protein